MQVSRQETPNSDHVVPDGYDKDENVAGDDVEDGAVQEDDVEDNEVEDEVEDDSV